MKSVLTTSDGREEETELVSLREIMSVGKREIPCMLTSTTIKIQNAEVGVKKRWSSHEVPGFQVRLEFKGSGIEVKEWVTDFLVK